MPYLFQDTGLAARRLSVLAEVFTPASQAFLQDMVQARPELALDLGCGPGYTTRLLAETTDCAQAFGLDASAHFVELATEKYADTRISFVHHDLTHIPFPIGTGDLLFCRMLLTHLRDPLAIIELWATQMRPHGRYCQLNEEMEELFLREKKKGRKEEQHGRGWCGVKRQFFRWSPRSTPGSDPA
jgi:trans-aconitate methyltransferase